jgi:carbon-monoxide dehydrogenase small subunit
MTDTRNIALSVNGSPVEGTVETRKHLADYLRQDLGLTGTHLGCEHGVCGACTVLVDGEAVRACLMLAVQANGKTVTTVEGLAPSATELHPLQQAFANHPALQCGYCTPGMLMSLAAYLRDHDNPDEASLREAISGNICRCTGYQGIVEAALAAAGQVRSMAEG